MGDNKSQKHRICDFMTPIFTLGWGWGGGAGSKSERFSDSMQMVSCYLPMNFMSLKATDKALIERF